MLFGTRLWLLIFFFIGVCNAGDREESKRPASVPVGSVWVGGLDGGHWISCAKRKDSNYYCYFYLSSGDLLLYGTFCKEDTKNIKNTELDYQRFDGLFVSLSSGARLLPDGLIRFPHDEEHGKKQFYKCGVSISEEIKY